MRLSFGEFTLDRATRQLLRAGGERHLEPKAFELLDLLLGRRPEAVSKSDIRDRLWPDTFVSESNLTDLVAQVRRGLGDSARRPRFIRTVHGFGYAFAAEATEESSVRASHRHMAARVIWNQQVMPLDVGENILGRDEDVKARVDAPGVSRRHARIVVTDSQATLEDLGSKNGTYLRERRLEAPAPLKDGDTFRLGRQLLVFRSSRKTVPTVTELASPRRSD
jgi:DNA-binding winged helix-turn-helix (wHTH) protein